MEKKLKWETFESALGDWACKIKPFFDKGGFEPIYSKLKEDSKEGRIICPSSINTYRAFEKCSFRDLKVVIMGMD